MLLSEMARSRVNEREDPGQGWSRSRWGRPGPNGSASSCPGNLCHRGSAFDVDDDAGRPVAQDPGGQAFLEDDLGLALLDGDDSSSRA